LQAIDRVHRIRQTKPVNILRFLVWASIDEKIFELQLKKVALAKDKTTNSQGFK
jgi:SWI/SNF-related matrix-associated actin-dependent regulator of chromatin subfamily A3